MKYIYATFFSLVFWSFITIKLVGTSFAAWSWWWVLCSIVPMLSLLVKHWGL